ncbi:hypothetical protein [Actinotignum sanguinis]|uniref:hypothetical protein n=1 Tax=Actinotignum sanguinis TaxID=1445614 RepID=UPI00254DE8F3|nr:hypothetical protein [Actinotignum sanguinis]MDK8657714.1 hypothetical protein [Actinotignum sanguinis]
MKNLPKRTRVIVISAIAVLVILAAIFGGMAYSKHREQKLCDERATTISELSQRAQDIKAKTTELFKDVKDEFGQGFPDQKALTDLENLVEHFSPTTHQCPTKVTVTETKARVEKMETSYNTVHESLTAYRTEQAKAKASSALDAAKTKLADLQKQAEAHLSALDGDVAGVEGNVDKLRQLIDASRSLSLSGDMTTLEQARAVIEKATKAASQADAIGAALGELEGAVQSREAARQAESQARNQASASSYTPRTESSSYDSDDSYSSGGSYTPSSSYSDEPEVQPSYQVSWPEPVSTLSAEERRATKGNCIMMEAEGGYITKCG